MTQQEWDSVVTTNLSGAFRLVQQFLGEMQSQSYGRVVLVGSAAALVGRPGQTAYCASNAALEGLVRALAVEMAGHDVLVDAVAPGLIAEEPDGLASEQFRKQFVASTALRRTGQASEVAEAVLFLCGSEPTAVALVVARPADDTDALLRLARMTSTPARLERVQRRTESLAAHAALVLAVGEATGWRASEAGILVDVRPSGAPTVTVAVPSCSVSVSLSHERDLIAALARIELQR